MALAFGVYDQPQTVELILKWKAKGCEWNGWTPYIYVECDGTMHEVPSGYRGWPNKEAAEPYTGRTDNLTPLRPRSQCTLMKAWLGRDVCVCEFGGSHDYCPQRIVGTWKGWTR
jgi:hypothetical protein